MMYQIPSPSIANYWDLYQSGSFLELCVDGTWRRRTRSTYTRWLPNFTRKWCFFSKKLCFFGLFL